MLDFFKVSRSLLMICLPQTHRVKKSRLGSAAPPNRPELPLLSEGGFTAFFWPGAVKKAHKQIEGGKKKALQIWLSGVWKPANFIRNEQKMKSSDSFIWKKSHSGELHTCLKGLCKYWKYPWANHPSQTHLYICIHHSTVTYQDLCG